MPRTIYKNKAVENSVVINDFLLEQRTKGTAYTYKSFLRKYFEELGEDPDNYFKPERDYKRDAILFAKSISDKSPNYQRGAATCIRMFFEENDVELPNKIWKKIRKISGVTVSLTDTKCPTPMQLKQVLQHGGIKERAIFLTIVSSGMRIGETMQLKHKDINFDSTPTRIRVRANYTKTGRPRTVFISDEASNALNEWLKPSERDKYINDAIAKCNIKNCKPVNDDRIFPFSPVTARVFWNRMLKKAELSDIDTDTNREKMSPHSLRRYFKTYSGMKYVERLMGHEGDRTREYDKTPEEVIKKDYLEHMNNLMVFEKRTVIDNTKEIAELEAKIDEQDKAMHEMSKLIDQLFRLNNPEPPKPSKVRHR